MRSMTFEDARAPSPAAGKVEPDAAFRSLADSAPVMIWVTDVDGRCVYLNRPWYAFTGQTSEEAEGFGWLDATHPDDSTEAERVFRQANADRAAFRLEYRLRRADGVYRWAIDAASPRWSESGDFLGYVGSVIDIDDRREAENRLAVSEARYAALFEAIDAGFCEVEVALNTPHGRIDYRVVAANPAFYAQTGFPQEIFGRWLREASPSLEEHWFETYGRVARTGEPERFEQGSDLLGRWFDVYAFRIGDAAENRVAILFNDISPRRQAETRLHQLNDALEAKVAERTAERDEIWRNSGDLMLVAAHDTTMIAVNPAWESILGWSEPALVGRSFMEFVHPEDVAATEVEAKRLVEPGASALHFHNRYRRADGGWTWLSWAVSSSGGRFYAVARDVTASKAQAEALAETQEALRQSQKMEAIGSLTGGVAHDFNNLLTPIIGALDRLERRGLGEERDQRLVEGALQSAERARTLVHRLLAFARRQPLKPVAVDLAGLVKGMKDLIASTTGPQIHVVVRAEDGLPAASADPHQIEMALLNLAVNARDAMPEGGTLTLAAQSARLETGNRLDLPAGAYVRLSLADTGTGMDAETLERATEPFFSTKGVGQGTGLGLSMAHGLASQLGGALTLNSRPGRGTTIELLLPVSTLAPPTEARAPTEASRGSGLVLLVDDEALVRLSTAAMLADLGYEVIESESSTEALAQIRSGLSPDYLVTDHLMPGIDGAALARAVQSIRPDTKILIISGYADADQIAPDLARLTKPFRSEALAASLAALTQGR